MAETPFKILFISAEVAPFAKRGGLGDVAGSLPKALQALGHDVRVVMPAYGNIEAGYPGVKPGEIQLQIPIRGQTVPAGIFEGTLPGSTVPVFFIGQWNLFNRAQVYGYEDDPYRFAFFSRAALDLVVAAQGWRPDIVHAHDWHAAPAVTWLATAGQVDARYRDLATVFTIHNLAHQGKTTWDIFDYLGIVTYTLNEESFNEVNFMARAIHHATMVSTVSPTYAQEIMTPAGGAGLDGLLRGRHFDLHGILNGLDYEEWNPESDPRLPAHYDGENLAVKSDLKRALQTRAGLPQRDDIPLLAMVSRLDFQKGLDIMGEALHRLMNSWAGEAQFVVLGTGESEYEAMFAHLAGYHREKMTAFLAYNADLAPLIYAGSDMFLMPSLFEPCGLGQLIAMRYGSVPVVRATGGLVDTVREGETGFLYGPQTADALWDAIARAIFVYNVDKPRWREIQRRGMESDFSWARSAAGYEQMYQWAISRKRGW